METSSDRRTLRRLGLVAFGVTILSYVLGMLPDALELAVEGNRESLPGWLPTFGTLGETLVVYQYAEILGGFLLLTVLAFVVAYRAGRRLDVRQRYVSLLRTTAYGGAAGVLVSAALVGILMESVNPGAGIAYVAMVFVSGVSRLIELAITVLAGAAVGHFRERSSGTIPGVAGTPAD